MRKWEAPLCADSLRPKAITGWHPLPHWAGLPQRGVLPMWEGPFRRVPRLWDLLKALSLVEELPRPG